MLDYEGNRQELLCYYFGFWLPSALFAKLTGSMEAGYLFQLLYAVIGASIAMMMVCRYAGAAKLRIPFIFLLFCGWDIVAYLLLLSYGVYLPFVRKEIRHDYTFWLLFGSMCILSWTRLGDAPDMGIRCAIPSFLIASMPAI